MWSKLSNYKDVALLLFRIAFGTFFIYIHGFKDLAGGLGQWKVLGGYMKHVGISFWPGFWGFMAAFSETIGVGLLIIGLAFRPSCLLLTLTMAIVALHDYHGGGLGRASEPIELALVFVVLIFIGPGKYSVDKS